MTIDEFKECLANHLKKFPQLKKESLDRDSWWDALKQYPKDRVISASALMFSGHIKRPFYASDHVSAIVDHCASVDSPSEAFRVAKAEGKGDCCNQTGLRKVYHPQDIMRLLIHRFPDRYGDAVKNKHGSRETIPMENFRKQSIACDCELGFAKFPRKAPNPWPHLGDKYWHIEVDPELDCDKIVEIFLKQEAQHLNPLNLE